MTTIPINAWQAFAGEIPIRWDNRVAEVSGRSDHPAKPGLSRRETSLPSSSEPGNTMAPNRPANPAKVSTPDRGGSIVSESVEHDIALLARVARQESEALAELYDRFSPILFGLACRMLNSEAEAEDVLQDVFLKIWEKGASYDSRLGTPIAWLITLTRNRANDRLRSVTRRSRILEVFKTQEESAERSDQPGPTEHVMVQETVAVLRGALDRLPDDQRRAIEMAFLSGLSQTEIATELNQPLGTIKARIRRGMMSLREHLPAEWRSEDHDSGDSKDLNPGRRGAIK